MANVDILIDFNHFIAQLFALWIPLKTKTYIRIECFLHAVCRLQRNVEMFVRFHLDVNMHTYIYTNKWKKRHQYSQGKWCWWAIGLCFHSLPSTAIIVTSLEPHSFHEYKYELYKADKLQILAIEYRWFLNVELQSFSS